MTRARTLLDVSLVGFLALSIVVGAGCHTALHGPFKLDAYERVAWIDLEADSATSGPYLAIRPAGDDAPSVASFQSGQATDGVQRALQHTTNGPLPSPVVFELRGGNPQTYYLNLSQPITGTLYVANLLSAASGVNLDAGKIRAELWTNGSRLAGFEYDMDAPASRTSGTAYVPIHFSVPVEQPTLPAGAPLQLKVWQISGMANLVLGTGGTAQSHIEIHYYDVSPLAGAVYLENHKLAANPTDTSPGALMEYVHLLQDDGTWSKLPEGSVVLVPPSAAHGRLLAWVGLGAAAPFLGLFALGPRRGKLAFLATVLLVSLVFAGCLGGAKDARGAANLDDADATPTGGVSNQTFVENQTLAEKGVGALRGIVQDSNGLRIPGANLALLGTTTSTQSDKEGRFGFENLPAKSYTLRVDARTYASLEVDVTVQVGTVNVVNITLVTSQQVDMGDKAHLHNEWGEASRLQSQQLSFQPGTNAYEVSEVATPVVHLCENHAGSYQTSGADAGYDTGARCKYEIPIDFTSRVIPGTGRIEVFLKWDTSGLNAPPELGLTFSNAVRTDSYKNALTPRGPNDPFNIAFFPNEADPGHQRFTNWQFWLMVPSVDTYAPWAPVAYNVPAVTVQIFVDKTVLPYEPAHPDRWYGQTSKVLVKQGTVTSGNYCLPNGSTYIAIDKNGFVPNGATKVVGTFTFGFSQAQLAGVAVPAIQYGLRYKPANIPLAEWDQGLKPVKVIERTATSIKFEIVPLPEETDQPYQTTSNWRFYPATDDQACAYSTYGTSYRGGTAFGLEATVLK